MIPEQQLRDLEELITPDSHVWVAPETFAQLVAAARVGNAAARVEREERDNSRRDYDSRCALAHSVFVGNARTELIRALRHYEAVEPAGVKP